MRRLAVLAALALVAGTAQAQTEPRRFNVGAHAGGYSFDKATGLENVAFIGVDAMYQFPAIPLGGRGLEPGVGFYFTGARPTTKYDQFPVVLFDFGDTTFLYGVSQRVQVMEWGAQASLAATIGRLRPYVMGGAGMYTIQVDPRQEGLKTYNEPAFQVGGGLNFVVSRSIGFKAEVRSTTWTSFDRDRLDPSVAYSHDRVIRDELSSPVAEKSTLQNLKYAIVFSYVPGGRSSDPNAAPAGGNP